MSTWLSGVIGQGIAANPSGCSNITQQYSQAQAMAAQQQYAYGAQNMAAGHQQQWRPPQWMFDGKTMEFTEFVNSIFPEDSAEKTAFVLKWSK